MASGSLFDALSSNKSAALNDHLKSSNPLCCSLLLSCLLLRLHKVLKQESSRKSAGPHSLDSHFTQQIADFIEKPILAQRKRKFQTVVTQSTFFLFWNIGNSSKQPGTFSATLCCPERFYPFHFINLVSSQHQPSFEKQPKDWKRHHQNDWTVYYNYAEILGRSFIDLLNHFEQLKFSIRSCPCETQAWDTEQVTCW